MLEIDKIWNGNTPVLLTSFWGWSPETWAMLSFSTEGRRETVIRETTDPFIALIYVTKNAPIDDKSLRGKIVGFYLCSHQKGHRDEFTHVSHHGREPDKWLYGLKTTHAFSFHRDHLMDIDDFDPTLSQEQRNQSVGTHGEILKDLQNWQKLKDIPFRQVACFDTEEDKDFGHEPWLLHGQGMVRAGPNNQGGYYVSPNSKDLPRQLYVLRLKGNTEHFLGKPSEGRSIYKVGLSVEPSLRKAAFNKALPNGEFEWETYRTTRQNWSEAHFTFDAAVDGETAMKKHLHEKGEWLGGEFYLATDSDIHDAWSLGNSSASQFGVSVS